jgi:nicotinamidase-related amidase
MGNPDPSLPAALLVVDVQEAFRGAVKDFPLIASRISTAVRAFDLLGIAPVITEQNPKGLGRTADEIMLSLADDTAIVEKTTFSAGREAGVLELLEKAEADQIVICGIETHICVNQTAHDLLDQGFAVHVLTDCVASRFDHDKQAGLSKMLASGVVPSCTEMAIFELMKDSKDERFRQIQALIK